jgi:phospholipid/cholesterol/gamma-HCH transport system permease protein
VEASVADRRDGQGAVQRWIGEHIEHLPGFSWVATFAEVSILGVRVARVAVSPPYPWVSDAIDEFVIAFRRCILPLLLSAIAFSAGVAFLAVISILNALGTLDRFGGGAYAGYTREVALWVTSMIFAGVAGSAATADLGARKIREELDALAVLGVDVIRSTVVPRVMAMAVLAPVLGLITMAVTIGTSLLMAPALYENIQTSVFIDTFQAFVSTGDLIALIIKCVCVGFFVAVVCCHKGMSSEGGAEGVGRAVNQAVVITFLGIWVFNTAFNAAYLALFPGVQVLRG